MTEKKSSEEKAYLNGFYAALKGVMYCVEDAEATLPLVRQAVQDTLDQMRDDGDLDEMESGVDELIELVRLAEEAGKVEELFAILDNHYGGK